VNFIVKTYALFCLSFLLVSCNSEQKMSPEEVAVAFFDAIYNKNDLDEALTYCSPELAQEVSQYVSAKNAARRLFNMSFDSVEINAAFGDMNVRQEFTTSGQLTILFTGYNQGRLYKDLKNIRMIKKDRNWLIDEFLPDPDYN